MYFVIHSLFESLGNFIVTLRIEHNNAIIRGVAISGEREANLRDNKNNSGECSVEINQTD